MKELNTKEKMELISSRQFYSADYDGELCWDENGQPFIRHNLREWISRRIKEEEVTQKSIANFVGKTDRHFSDYLRGRRLFPINALEKIIWLLTPGNCRVKDDSDMGEKSETI